MVDLLEKWRSGLAKTSKTAFGRLATLLGATEINRETWDELEALLVQADLGIETSTEILDSMRRVVQSRGLIRRLLEINSLIWYQDYHSHFLHLDQRHA